MPKIILTADRATLSHYHHNLYLGFFSCFPDRLCPGFLYRLIVPRPGHDSAGSVERPNLSLRAVEAACLSGGFKPEEIQILHPDFLESQITERTGIVGVSAHDPLGFGPATTTWSTIFKGTPYNRKYFFRLMDRLKAIKTRLGFKVVVGGPGAWQLTSPRVMDELGIDHVVLGEGEIAIPKLFTSILGGGGRADPVFRDRPPQAHEIPPLVGPSAHDLIEITRGCGRGCDFCAPSASGDFRSLPAEKVLDDLKTYLSRGSTGAVFHSEDSLRYGSSSLLAEKDALLDLFGRGFDLGAKSLSITHASFVHIATQPDVVEALTRLVNAHGMEFFGCQPGLETGSSRLIQRTMKGKVHPRDPQDWQEIVWQALNVMKANRWYAVCTLICGLPEEDAEDVKMTTRLIKKLGPFEALYVPLFFAPTSLTRLGDRKRFVAENMLREHWELMLACWDHNFEHLDKLYRMTCAGHSPAFQTLVRSLLVLLEGWTKVGRGFVLHQAEKRSARKARAS